MTAVWMNLSALLSGLDTVSVLTVKSEAITVHIVFRIFGIQILVHTSAKINSIFLPHFLFSRRKTGTVWMSSGSKSGLSKVFWALRGEWVAVTGEDTSEGDQLRYFWEAGTLCYQGLLHLHHVLVRTVSSSLIFKWNISGSLNLQFQLQLYSNQILLSKLISLAVYYQLRCILLIHNCNCSTGVLVFAIACCFIVFLFVCLLFFQFVCFLFHWSPFCTIPCHLGWTS